MKRWYWIAGGVAIVVMIILIWFMVTGVDSDGRLKKKLVDATLGDFFLVMMVHAILTGSFSKG